MAGIQYLTRKNQTGYAEKWLVRVGVVEMPVICLNLDDYHDNNYNSTK